VAGDAKDWKLPKEGEIQDDGRLGRLQPLRGRFSTRTVAGAAARVGAAARGADIAAARYRIFRASKTGPAARQTRRRFASSRIDACCQRVCNFSPNDAGLEGL